MGYECGESGYEHMIMLTNKPVRHLTGNTVWLIAGKYKPRRYYLCATFVVDDIGPTNKAGFRFFASGRKGTRFKPLLAIDEEPWFDEFRRSQANFSLGVREIPPRFVRLFQSVTGG